MSNRCIKKIKDSELWYKLFREHDDKMYYMHMQTIHKLQLQDIRAKYRNGHRIRVLFFVMQASKFGYDSIIRCMQDSEVFEPFVLVASHYDNLFDVNEMYWNIVVRDYELTCKKGFETFFAYDENRQPIPLWKFSPDIIFYNELTNLGFYKNYNINNNYLTCYLGYGIATGNRAKIQYRTYQRNACWKHFSETRYALEEYCKYSSIHGINAVLSGYPKLDEYCLNVKNCEVRKLVIYAPHWSIQDKNGYNLNYATFPIYYKKMLNLVKENPDIDFLFKPHPRLGIRIRELEDEAFFMTYQDYIDYIKEWESLDNGFISMDGDYIEYFKKSSCMIMDSGSFISEYLPSGHPCIYLINPKKNDPLSDYNAFSRKILETYYCCKDWNSVLDTFKNIIYNQSDPKLADREKVLKEFTNVGDAGKEIVEYLEKQIKE